jgi:hypothetical protein
LAAVAAVDQAVQQTLNRPLAVAVAVQVQPFSSG